MFWLSLYVIDHNCDCDCDCQLMLMGARSAWIVRAPAASNINVDKLWFSTVVVVLVSMLSSCRSMPSDAEALLKFRDSLTNVVSLSSWEPSINPKPPCSGNTPNWVGLFCINDRVWGLRLENMGLTGNIDVGSLGSLSSLRTLSLMNNTFTGPLPNIKMLPNLKALYLSFNHFSGQIPDDAFAGLDKLRKVYLANNEFTGTIPSSLAALPGLLVLRLDANKFHGQIPPHFQRNSHLKIINLSNNDLEGPIPGNLSTFGASSFSGTYTYITLMQQCT